MYYLTKNIWKVNQIQLTSNQIKSVQEYCKLNNIEDIDGFILKCFTSGFNIEKYGLLNFNPQNEKIVEKEIIIEKQVEVPVEVIKEVIKEVPSPPVEIEVIKYVDREVVKEVKVEVPVEKIVYIYDKKEEELVPNLDNICDKPEPIIIEKIVEVPVEVIKEVIVENDTDSKLKPKLDALQQTVQKLKLDNIEKDKLIKEYEKTIQDIQNFNEGTKAMFLKGSNLGNKL
jgi:hypothetical protein